MSFKKTYIRGAIYLTGVFVFLFFLFLVPCTGQSQSNRLINTHSWQYEYIKQLQQRGHLLSLNPTDLPYTHKDVTKALEQIDSLQLNQRERQWFELLKKNFENHANNIGQLRAGGVFSAGIRHSSSRRLNVDDPLGKADFLLPRMRLNGYLESNRLIGQFGLTFDLYYDRDPDGLDTARRLFMRSEETYFGYNSDILDIYIGRFDNHWSLYNRKGAFLTDNPRSFDQIQLKFGSSKISFSSIFGELDSMDPDSTFDGDGFEEGSIRRFLFLHRLDWSPLQNLKISLMEGELYSSRSASVSIRNLIPLHFLFFESHNTPMNNESNLIIGGSIWYQTGHLTLFVQGMVDDFIIEDRQERQENNSFKPISYTINSSFKLVGIGNSFDIGIENDLVGANSYRTAQFQDQWTYAQRGLATNFSDYVRNKAYATFYPAGIPGLQVEPALTLYLKGEADLRDLRTARNPDGSRIESILSGTVERTIRPSIYLRYQPVNLSLFGNNRFNLWMDADIGVNFTNDVGHIEGARDTRFVGLFRLFGQMTF